MGNDRLARNESRNLNPRTLEPEFHFPMPFSDWNAASYHRVSGPQLEWGRAVLDSVSLSGSERVLDAGCGTGRLLALLRTRLPHGQAIGLDRSREMLLAARDHVGQSGRQGRLVRADLRDLPFDRAFDIIFSAATFHWIHDHPRLFGSLYDALLPGGWLVAQCGGGPNLDGFHARAAELMASATFASSFVSWRDPWLFADAATTASRLAAAGFVEIATSIQPAPTSFESRASYTDFLRAVVARPHLGYLPTPELKSDFLERLADRAEADDPPFTLDYWRLNLRARRPA
jgi:trans-aconitate 2-methyltransferase